MFFKNQDESYTMIDPYLYNGFFGYKNSYSYYDIDADKILLFKKSDGKYFIRYNDVYYTKLQLYDDNYNIMMYIIPLQLRIDHFYGEIHTYANNDRVMYIHSDNKKLFRKCREIQNGITKLIGINNTPNFVRTAIDDGDEYIDVDVNKNTSFVKGNPKDIKELVIVLDSVIGDCLKTSLVQYKY